MNLNPFFFSLPDLGSTFRFLATMYRLLIVASACLGTCQSTEKPRPVLAAAVPVFDGSTPNASRFADFTKALQSSGVAVLTPGIVDHQTIQAIDVWLLQAAGGGHLLQHPVRAPEGRFHGMVLPSDGNGRIARAVGKIARATGVGRRGAGLAELGVFIVRPNASAQPRHVDRHIPGFVSCQLALHDTGVQSGGLSVWPWTSRGSITRVEMAPLSAGSVVCYDGQLNHRGEGHSTSAEFRRVLYFTAAQSSTTELSEAALHPRLRCAPLRNAPLLPLQLLDSADIPPQEQNAWYSKHVCQSAFPD